jgi:hypothetical protein
VPDDVSERFKMTVLPGVPVPAERPRVTDWAPAQPEAKTASSTSWTLGTDTLAFFTATMSSYKLYRDDESISIGCRDTIS